MKLLAALIGTCMLSAVSAAPANPLPHVYKQPDGTDTPELILNGNEQYAWMTDTKGYHVLRDTEGWYVYARKENGKMVSTGVRVGHKNPKKLGLTRMETADAKDRLRKSMTEKQKGRRRLQQNEAICNRLGTKDSPCKKKGIVVLMRFKDHANRKLPSSSDYDVLFNNNGPDAAIAPTGSVYDIFMENSYGAYVYENHITEWVTVTKTEKEANHGNLGLNTANGRATWKEALSLLDQQGFNFADFDADSSGMVDSVVILHSGAGAEVGKIDCDSGATWEDRIWSHQTDTLGFSADGVNVDAYYVASAVTHYCPLDAKWKDAPGGNWGIARIGVIAHECGHFLGVDDLYDPSGGAGVGTFDLMGNMWGWSPQPQWAQLLPPLMGAWSKKQLNWNNIIHINGNVAHFLLKSCTSDVAWEVNYNMPNKEYFLLELRYPCGYDIGMDHPKDWLRDRGGLAIWHIDDNVRDADGFVEQSLGRPPPKDGTFANHYAVALVQGDGNFNLEERPPIEQGGLGNKGDSSDLFMNLWGQRSDKGYLIDNSGTTLCDGVTSHSEPNTKSYSSGTEQPNGIKIEVDWGYDTWMGVKVYLDGAGDHRGTILPPK